jgi:hypothetical protein
MGLNMKERQAVTREYRPRYQKAAKKEKRVLPGEFTRLTEYRRKSAVRLLSYKPVRGKGREALMSSMASATRLFVPFSRARSPTPNAGWSRSGFCKTTREPNLRGAPPCQTLSSPGFTVFRSKRVCTGTWDRREAPARVVLIPRISRAFRARASSRPVRAPLIFTGRAFCSSLIP